MATWQTAGEVAYSAQNGTSVSPAHPTGSAEGDKLILVVGQKPSAANGGTCSTPSDWNPVATANNTDPTNTGGYGTSLAADTGNTNLYVFERTVPAGGLSGNLTVTVGTNNVAWAYIARLTPAANHTWDSIAASVGKDTTDGSAISVAASSAPGFAAGDAVLGCFCCPTDAITGFSSYGFAASGATFSTAVQDAYADSGTGNDIGGFSCDAYVTAGSSTSNPTLTATAAGTVSNVRGPGIVVRIREAEIALSTGSMDASETGSDALSASGSISWPAVTGNLAASETNPDAFMATGAVPVNGALTATEVGSDTSSASGSVAWPGVSGSLAATEAGADTFAATASVAWAPITGSLTASETGLDTLVSAGQVVVQGTAAAVETSRDTLASVGQVVVQGTAAAVETGPDTLAASGSASWGAPLSGALAATEAGADTFSSSGSVTWGDINGVMTATELVGDTFAGTGIVRVTGALMGIDTGADSFTAAALVRVQGSLVVSELGQDIFAATSAVPLTRAPAGPAPRLRDATGPQRPSNAQASNRPAVRQTARPRQ